MQTRSWRKWWVAGALLLLMAQGADAARSLQDYEERVLQAIARHADREAATTLVEAWQRRSQGGVSPGGVALSEGLSGHYLTAKQLMARVVAEHPEDASMRLGSLVLALLEGNPPTCRKAIEDVAASYPENPQLQRRYSDVLESMGLASVPLPTPPEEPVEVPDIEPTPARPAATPAPEAREIRPVQAESVREQVLRQLAEAQARQAKEEADRRQRLKDEQVRKRREEAARLASEKKRREEAARQAAEQQRQQELARAAAERAKKQEQARLAQVKKAAAHKANVPAKPEPTPSRAPTKQEQARLAAEQRRRLEAAEQERWLAARRTQPSPPPASPVPTPPASDYVLKPVKIANRRVWIGEDRASVHARLGRPSRVEGPELERYAGLSIWYDAHGKVQTFELASAWYYGPNGVRPGLTLREVLQAMPNSDGLFHLRPDEPDATRSLYVLSTVDGTLTELQFNDEVWLSTLVRTTTPAGATHLYEELLKQGPVRRLAPDYVFALEARHRPLP